MSEAPIRLLLFDLESIAAARRDPTRFEGIPVVDGGLPPSFILDGAWTSLQEGRRPLWFAPFAFVDTSSGTEGRVVGSGIFKGEPDDGWVEIGYGIAESCQGRGHATDAVTTMVELAFAQHEVRAVYAETEVDNVASRRVVQKVGFTYTGQRDSEDHGRVDCWFIERDTAASSLPSS